MHVCLNPRIFNKKIPNRKAQIVVEFMLIVFIVVVYISTVLLPSANTLTDNLYDTSNLSKLDIQVKKINSTIEQMTYHVDSEFHLPFYLSKDSNFFCKDASNLCYTLRMDSNFNPRPCLTTGSTPSSPTGNCCYLYNGSLHCSKIFPNTYVWNCSQTPLMNLTGPFSGNLILKTLITNDVNIIVSEAS